MHVVDTNKIYAMRKRQVRRKRRARVGVVLLAAMVLVSGGGYVAYQRPLPDTTAIQQFSFNSNSSKPDLVWPGYGQAAIGTIDYGLLDTHGEQKPASTASVAKVMTALAVLQQKPLTTGQQGPLITINDDDIASYNYYATHDGSLVYVIKDEQISEYQALQALLIPSANNMAETLARWAFGSIAAYNTYANNLATTIGMTNTKITDPSGFAPETVSTASDLVRLGILAMKQPVIADIVRQSEATIPVSGKITTTNPIVGSNEIIGIKTGLTDQAGGCYMFAAHHDFGNGHSQVVVGVIMSAPTFGRVISDSQPLLASTYKGFRDVTVVKKGQSLGSYRLNWGAEVGAVASTEVKVFGWKDEVLSPKLVLNKLPANAIGGQDVGSIMLSSKIDKSSSVIIADRPVTSPGVKWRLTHVY